MLKRPVYLAGVALLIAWSFDLLFWKKAPGISFAIFVGVCLLGGFFLAWVEGVRPARSSLFLLLPISFFGVMTFIRQESFTLFIDVLAVLALMGMFAHTFLGGRWFWYSFGDYVAGAFKLTGAALSRAAVLYFRQRKTVEPGEPLPEVKKSTIKRIAPVGRGLLLALPVVVLFASLLASADLVFSQQLKDFVSIFRLENLPEYIFRCIYILVLAYLLGGVYVFALQSSRDEKLLGMDKSWLAPFLGFTESAIVLGSVDLLFALFVGFQFKYFFGGQSNIHLEGFTYAEYARRGFGELVAVVFFSLLLFLALSTVARRVSPVQSYAFSGLGIALVLLIGVILVSAFQRLVLYEDAYGFSRLRTYTHVFMIWLGVLLLALVVLEVLRRQRAFALAAFLTVVGFTLSLNMLNVDAFIVRQNVTRSLSGKALDSGYILTLSDDSVPGLFNLYDDPTLPLPLHSQIGGILACRAALTQADDRKLPWQSFQFPNSRAHQLFMTHQPDLSAYPTTLDPTGGWMVKVNGVSQQCFSAPFTD